MSSAHPLSPLGCFAGFCSPVATAESSARKKNPLKNSQPNVSGLSPGLSVSKPVNPAESLGYLGAGTLLGAWLHRLLPGGGASARTASVSTPTNTLLNGLKSNRLAATTYLPAALKRQQYLNFNTPLFALVRLATLYEQYHGPLLAYIAATGLGAVAASVLKGWQESWVRQQETLIRQQLVTELQSTYATSIQQKYGYDAQLKQQTRQMIGEALKNVGIAPGKYLNAGAATPIPEADAHFNLQPQSRTAEATVTGSRFGQAKTALTEREPPARQFQQSQQSQPPQLPVLPVVLTGIGAGIGLLLGQILKWLKQQHHTLPLAQQEVMECLVTTDLESAFLLRHKGMLAAVFALGSLAKVGQLLLDAAREVSVTQKNAQTEKQYQQANWLQLDPRFHEIAEQAALNAEWTQFVQDLPELKTNPRQLQQRVDTLLSNRGRSSPPPYYLATPPVMLTDAKS